MRREEGGRLRNPRGRLSLGREAGGTQGLGGDTGGMVSGDTWGMVSVDTGWTVTSEARKTGGESHFVYWC